MNLPSVAAHRALEMLRVGRSNRHLVAIEAILLRSPKYVPARSCFRFAYGQLLAQMNNVSGPDPEFIPIYCRP